MSSDLMENKTGRAAGEWFFWFCAVVLLGLFLWVNALWGSENRWAEVVREMILTGDYLHPAINWQIYFDKPQLSYWFILPFAWLWGVNELTVRIPSAIAALVALYATRELARTFFDDCTARLSGWVLLSSYGFIWWGRCAAADMENLAAIVLAVYWFFRVEKAPGFWKYFGFYLIAFTGALAKGLPALVMPFAVVAPYVLWNRRIAAHLRWSDLFAFLFAAAIYAVPLALAAKIAPNPLFTYPDGALSGWELVWRENVIRVFQPFDHQDPWFSYLYNLPRVMLPWTPLLITGIVSLIRRRKAVSRDAVLLGAGAVLMFLLFSFSGSRRWYYILPMMPFCAIFGAAGIADACSDGKWMTKCVSGMRYLVLILGSVALVSPVGIFIWRMIRPGEALPVITLASIPVAGLLTLLVMLLDSDPPREGWVCRRTGWPSQVASMVVGITILCCAGFSCVWPSCTVFRSERSFFQSVRRLCDQQKVTPDRLIFLWDEPYANGVYYMDLRSPAVWVKPASPQQTAAELSKLFAAHQEETFGILMKNRRRYGKTWPETVSLLGVDLKPDMPALSESVSEEFGKRDHAGDWRFFLAAPAPKKAEKNPILAPLQKVGAIVEKGRPVKNLKKLIESSGDHKPWKTKRSNSSRWSSPSITRRAAFRN